MNDFPELHAGNPHRTRGMPDSFSAQDGSKGFVCADCGSKKTTVIDSRNGRLSQYIRRRRCCPDCGLRFTTFEIRAAVYNKLVGAYDDLSSEIVSAIALVLGRYKVLK